jgi:hypothetical protein
MDGSNGKIIELLERIATSQEATRDEVARLGERVDHLEGVVEHGFDQVNLRLDNMLVFLGRHHGDHEQRITALETHVFKKRKA